MRLLIILTVILISSCDSRNSKYSQTESVDFSIKLDSLSRLVEITLQGEGEYHCPAELKPIAEEIDGWDGFYEGTGTRLYLTDAYINETNRLLICLPSIAAVSERSAVVAISYDGK